MAAAQGVVSESIIPKIERECKRALGESEPNGAHLSARPWTHKLFLEAIQGKLSAKGY
jgi:hypothetical protein